MFKSCGCKICKNNLGELTNQLNNEGYSPNEIINELKNEGLEVSKKLISRHLSAYGLVMNKEKIYNEDLELEPIDIDMNDFDFSKYNFDIQNPVTVVSYLQKLHLKIHLNQSEILLKLQNDVLQGKAIDIPQEALRNLAITWKILSEVSGINIYSNQQAAIKTVEAMGLKVEQFESYLLPENTINQENV